MTELLFRDFDYLALLVITAVRASAMGHPQFVTVGTLGERSCRQMIVCSTTITTSFGVPAFRIWHMFFSSALPCAA
jgi:hypothetical protein